MQFKTSISKLIEEDIILRGRKLSSLMEGSFSDAIFLLLGKRMPNEKESKLFNAMLVSVVDHGMGTASSLSSRFVMSTGNSLNTAVGAGVLALGDLHGGAIEKAMEQLLSDDESDLYYGFGHKVYKEKDPRVVKILSLCKELDYNSKYIDKALKIEEKLKEKKVILNIDGLIAAILLEMGFDSSVGKGFFIVGRVPGLVAQAVEEKESEEKVRRLDEEDIKYNS